MNKKLFFAAFTSVLAIAAVAHAEEGFYVGLAGGANHVHDDKVKGTGINSSVKYDWGYTGLGTLGYQYDNGLRSELELGYRRNNLDSIGNVNANGDVAAATAMLNVLYDFDLSDTFTTYVGVGGGVARVDYNKFRTAAATVINDSDTVPAVQGIVGASYPLTEKADAFLNYQYLHAIDPSYKASTGAKVKTDYDASSILVGVKFKLYDAAPAAVAPVAIAAAAPAKPAPAPQAAPTPISRTYIVFFDFDKSELTEEAEAVLNQAAQDARAGRAVALQVVGHADRAGTDSYNMALSNRRASVVKSALSHFGITDNSIQTAAKGESEPLVPTDDGVREPQNRRVEIMYVIEAQK
jgi:outer membrane protein OmpA-like peptidoglycan-associated protein